ncbi:hypothetical protein [Prochlorococcus marinus]|uniref:hypothetical protein n=1 Tax=Prochlorococcus marinus TaxID=1219 RepID=UPI0007BBA166|nr:hypothetical protein [Prochlorococcus marinus]KZR77213.1 hypothetical protein PMIT1320_00501 [Prochlorococcus marinus str. MIT 1320]
MEINFQNLVEIFVELGGIAENICLRKGELGRGIFPVDTSRRTKIMTPKSLLINLNQVGICHDEIYIKDASQFSAKEKNFLEFNYNHAWSGGGNICSAEFLKYVSTIPESIKSQLLGCGFMDKALLNSCPDENRVLKRFVDERVVSFEGNSVLASIWDLVNHSSFAPPLRITSYGVETPPIEPSSEEILHKYSGKNSPVSMWKKYGFACKCIVAYSIPFSFNIGNQELSISCSGQLGLDPKEKANFSIVGDTLSIKSLPVGCLSNGLPQQNFKSILSSVGLSVDVANRLFPKIREVNIKVRHYLIDSLQEPGFGAKAELYKALMYEIELIENVSNG